MIEHRIIRVILTEKLSHLQPGGTVSQSMIIDYFTSQAFPIAVTDAAGHTFVRIKEETPINGDHVQTWQAIVGARYPSSITFTYPGGSTTTLALDPR